MKKPALTKARMRAIQAALAAMLAGVDREGDWPMDVPREALEGALAAINARLGVSP